MLILGGVLIFSGLLFAGFAPIAHQRLGRSAAWSKAVAALSRTPLSPAPAAGTLVAVRGKVSAEAPLEDPITSDPVVWFECEVRVGDGAPEMVRGETIFTVSDGAGVAQVDPAHAREVSVQIDTFGPDDDRDRVGPFLEQRGLGDRDDVSLEHRQVKVGAELVVVGRWPDDEDGTPTLAAGAEGELVLTTYSLEAFREREVASAEGGKLGVVILATLSLICTALGVALVALG